MSTARGQNGFALIAVLWIVSALSVIVATGLAQTRTDLHLTRTHLDLAKARALAEAGVYRGVYELLRSREAVRFGLPEEMPQLDWDGSVVEVHIENEAGKIDVNTASPDLLRSMFRKLGTFSAQTRAITGRYERLRGLDTGENDAAGRRDGFSSTRAFAARLDLPPAVWRRVSPWITVHNGQAGINPYVADREVLSLVPGFKASVLESEARKGSPDRLQSSFTGLDRRYFTDRLSPVYTIAARATVGGVSTTVEATIKMSAQRSRPYTILDWNETPRFRGG